jgi:hypothetical protein
MCVFRDQSKSSVFSLRIASKFEPVPTGKKVGYGREDTFSISPSDFQFVAVIGFDLILNCTLKPETRQRVFILIFIGAQLGALFIKIRAGCSKMYDLYNL